MYSMTNKNECLDNMMVIQQQTIYRRELSYLQVVADDSSYNHYHCYHWWSKELHVLRRIVRKVRRNFLHKGGASKKASGDQLEKN